MSEPTGTNEPPAEPARDVDDRADLLAVRITVTRESFGELMQRFALDVGCRPVVEQTEQTGDDRGTLLAFAPRTQIAELEAAGYQIEIGENVSEVGRQRQAEIGQGDRFEGGRAVPRGLGTKPQPGSKKGGRR